MDEFMNGDGSSFFSFRKIFYGDQGYRAVQYAATFMPELQMPNENLVCPRCGTTIHNVQKTRRLGCLNCYTVFEGQIGKIIKLIQPDAQYMGRVKGTEAEINIEDIGNETGKPEVNISGESSVVEASDVLGDAASIKSNGKSSSTCREDSKESRLERLKKADLGMLSDDELTNGMRLAAECKEYILANRLKEELNSRKDK